jgi:hypothetical protein
MTTVDSAQQASQVINSRLTQLRGQLRRWIAVDGLGRWLWWTLAILAADMALDRLFRMDLAQRGIVLGIMLVVALVLWVRRVGWPLSRPISNERLLMQVEGRNPHSRESVITTFQLAQQTDFAARGVSPSLVERTLATGLQNAQQIDFGNVLDLEKNKRNLLVLTAALIASLALAIGVTQVDFLQTWFRRNLLLTNDQWPQATYLELIGAVDGKIIVPRGADYRQLVEITADSRVANVDVTLEMESASGTSFQKMKPTGRASGREFGFVFHSIASEYRIRARGGDGLTDWVQLELVEPPAVMEMNLVAELPAYTGQDPQMFSGSGPHRLLTGSLLQLTVTTNKPVVHCRVTQDETVYELAATDATRQTFQIQLGQSTGGVVGGKYDLTLVDDTELNNLRDFSFTLRLTEDRPPVVRAKLLGISGLIVPRASVPVSFTVEDDFGLTRLGFETSWTAETTEGASALSLPIKQWGTLPPVPDESDVAVLNVEQLKLPPDTSLRIVLAADDNQVPTPGTGSSREFLLRIVTEEELRADLLRREIEQRKSFQQAYDAQLELMSEVKQLLATPPENLTADEINNQRQSKLVNLYRVQRGVGTSVDLVAQRFEEFLVEVQNNRLDEELAEQNPERTLTARFDNEIIQPIRAMDEELISVAARNIDNCQRNVADPSAFAQSINDTTVVQEAILAKMQEIMASMESSESFQEAVNRLMEIKRIEESLKKQIDAQGDTKGIFDDD